MECEAAGAEDDAVRRKLLAHFVHARDAEGRTLLHVAAAQIAPTLSLPPTG